MDACIHIDTISRIALCAVIFLYGFLLIGTGVRLEDNFEKLEEKRGSAGTIWLRINMELICATALASLVCVILLSILP